MTKSTSDDACSVLYAFLEYGHDDGAIAGHY